MSQIPPPPNPYSSPANYQPQKPIDDGQLTTLDWVLCILCSGIGCIVGIVRLVQGKKSGAKMIGISILFAIIWNVVSLVIRSMVAQQ